MKKNNLFKDNATMSEKSKLNRAKKAARQEKDAKKVINWIFAVLIILAIAFLVAFMTM